GVVRRIGEGGQQVEELSVYIHMEQFANGAAPYLRLSIRSDRPEELAIQVFHHENSAPMERCAITATMGNYARLRNLYLKDGVVWSNDVYAGYDGIDFIEKESYPLGQMLDDGNGSLWAIASGDETMSQLAN